ncbi:MAG: hypothetical protein LC793_12760 [Thermomicrobia bacterium]|nr:hypothetical protein [Thermomicrobia bacterium]MCA1723041.1 hypothetical protein [Thermomicrobia bacterium]
MYDATDFQVRYDDHRRQMTRVNEAGWQFDPPHARTRVRITVANALIALAARLFPAVGEMGEQEAASQADAGFSRNATIA